MTTTCLSFRRDVVAVGVAGVHQALRVRRQELHGEVDAVELAPFDRHVAPLGRPAAQDHGVELLDQLRRRDVPADLGVGHELHPLGLHQLQPPRHHRLVELHVRDAVHQQAADAVGALVHGDPVSGAVELRGAGEAGGAGPDDGDPPAGPFIRGLREHRA